jgi:four helix bundle protein
MVADEDRKKEFRRRIYHYVLKLIRFASALPVDAVSAELKSQLVRSGTSVGANYFEALAGSSKKDFLNFFSHSLKSANESKFWLSLLRDSGFLNENARKECEEILSETRQIANILASSILTMKGKRKAVT